MNNQELATVLAALRFYQANGQGNPANRSDAIHDIATAGDEVISLDDDGIDDLCERLNCEDGPKVLVNIHGGLVQDVYVDGKLGEVLILDWDQEGSGSDEELLSENNSSLFRSPNNQAGSIYGAICHPWNALEQHTEMEYAVAFANNAEPIIQAKYVSEWDNGTTVRTACKFDLRTCRVFDIEESDTDVHNCGLTEEYVELPNGLVLHDTDDGVNFDY